MKIKLTLIILALGSFSLYSQTLYFGFINFDDWTVLLGHPELYNERSFSSSLKHILFIAFPREEPLLLRDISWALDSRIFGFDNPFGYHLGNVILNSFNCALVFLFFWKTHNRYYLSLWFAVLYAVLPVRAEAVCWVMGRKDLLVSFFMLFSLILQTIELTTLSKQVRLRVYLLGILTTLAALLSKINALSFFMMLFLHRLFFPYLTGSMAPSQSFKNMSISGFLKPLFKVMPHFVISIFIFIWYQGILSQWGVLDRGVDSFSLLHLKNVLLFTPLVIGRYLKIIFFPGDFQIFYDWPSIHQPLTSWDVCLSIGLALLFLLLFLYTWQHHRDIWFYLTAFVILMLPYFNIIYIGIWIANRYVYFSSICILAGVLIFLDRTVLKTKQRWKMVSVVLTILAILWTVNTLEYQKIFKNDATLWSHETKAKHPTLMAYASMAIVHIEQADKEPDTDKRMLYYHKAAANIFSGLHRFERSKMKDSAPHLFQLHYVQGILAGRMNKPHEEQLPFFEKAYELNPHNKMVLWKMAETLFRLALKAGESQNRQMFAARSLDMMEKCMNVSRYDESHKAKIIQLLEKEYYPQFPFLRSRIKWLITSQKADFTGVVQ
jgi:hypothetical protein